MFCVWLGPGARSGASPVARRTRAEEGHVNTRQMRYFVAIAEERQITAAARRLGITQPPLSHELAAMERELGVRLVARGPRGAELTDAGRLLYRRALEVLEMTSAMEREVRSFGAGASGTLSLGLVSSSSGQIPAPFMREFVGDYPRVRFDVREGNTFEVIDLLNKGVVELGFVRTPFEAGGLECRYGAPEPMVAVMPASLTVGARPDEVTLEELSGVPIVMYRRYEALVAEEFERASCELAVACMNDDSRTTCTWARRGMGVGLVPEGMLETVNATDVTCKRVACPGLVTRLTLVRERGRRLSPVAERFLEGFSDWDVA